MRTKGCITGLLAALLFMACGFGRLGAAESPVDIMDQKLKVETQMEEKLKQVLAAYTGTPDIITVVRLGLADGAAAGDKGAAERNMRRWDENEELVLPGVPAAASMTKKAKADEARKDKKYAQLRLSNVKVAVLIGKKLNQKKMEYVKALILTMFGMDLDAGDSLAIDTYRAPSNYIGFRQAWILLAVFALALTFLFLFGPVRRLFKTLIEHIPALSAARPVLRHESGEEKLVDDQELEPEDRIARQGIAFVPDKVMPISGIAGAVEDGADLIKVITKDNIEDLRQALTDETPKAIATVVQRLPSELAFLAIPEGKMAAVISQFTDIRFEDPDKVKDVLQRIKTRVEWSFGGPMKLARMLQAMDRQLQENTLTLLGEKYPEFAMQVERRLFRFIDLLYYDETALKRIFRKAGIEPFAKCIKGCADDVAHLFYKKLGPSITELLVQYLKTMIATGGSTEAENKILQAIDELHKRGYIQSIEEIKEMQEKMEQSNWVDVPIEKEEKKKKKQQQQQEAVKEEETTGQEGLPAEQ